MSVPLIFEPGGQPWIPWPHIAIRGAGKEVLEALIRLGRNKRELRIADHVLARFLGRSIRYVQKGLKALETKGLIRRIRELTDGLFCRTILVMIRVATGNRYKKNAKDLGAKNFGPPRAQPCDSMAPNGACSSSFEEVYKQEQQAPGGGESVEADPPPGLGEEDAQAEAPDPAKDAEALAALKAQIAAASAPTPAQAASAAPRPIVRPSDRLRALPPDWRATLERLAAAGDRAAAAELATLPPAPETPSPAPDSPEVELPPERVD